MSTAEPTVVFQSGILATNAAVLTKFALFTSAVSFWENKELDKF